MKPYRVVFVFLTSLLVNTLSAQSASEKRSYMKTLPAGRNSKLEVVNKHGDIRITSWNKDSVFIMAEIEAVAPNQAKLGNMFDGIKIEIKEAGPIISARTEFDQAIQVILETFKGLTEKLIDYDSRVQINYFINIPDYIDAGIENQFGDISMENNTGDISVSLSHGGFKANSLNNVTDFTLNFGEAEISSVRSGKFALTFSELVLDESEDLNVNSTSSRYDLKKTGRLIVESRRDKIYADEITELGGVSYFTDFNIENFTGDLDLTLKYGSLDIEETGTRFERINLISAYSDITLGFNPAASYGFEIRHVNAFVVIPGDNTRSGKEALNEDKKEYLTSGTFGKNPGTRKVIIEATRGNIYLK